jgi:hypothetical protein
MCTACGSRRPQTGCLTGAGLVHPVGLTRERKAEMGEFFTSWWFIGIMAVLLIALIGLFFFLRNKQSED